MNVYRIYPLLIDLSFTPYWSLCLWQKWGEKFICCVFTLTPLLMIDKKGEKYLRYMQYLRYMHVFLGKGGEVFEIYACFACLRGRSICPPCLRGSSIYVYAYMLCFTNRRKRIWFGFSPFICIHVYTLSLHILLFIVMHELRGSFFEALL